MKVYLLFKLAFIDGFYAYNVIGVYTSREAAEAAAEEKGISLDGGNGYIEECQAEGGDND